jgi:hypothetical protein
MYPSLGNSLGERLVFTYKKNIPLPQFITIRSDNHLKITHFINIWVGREYFILLKP